MRRTNLNLLVGLAVATAGLSTRDGGDVLLVGDDWSSFDDTIRPSTGRSAARSQPAEPTAADLERQRMASERQARKVARQAKGFAPPPTPKGEEQ